MFVSAPHYIINSLFWHIFKWSLNRNSIFLTNRRNLPEYKRIFIFPQWKNASVINRHLHIRHYLRFINDIYIAKAFTFMASSLWRIKREIMWCWFWIRKACFRIHKHFAIMSYLVCFSIKNHQLIISMLECYPHCVAQAVHILS